MKTLTLTFPKLYCKRQQGLTGFHKDEIYVAIQVIAGKWDETLKTVVPAGDQTKIMVLPPVKIKAKETKAWNESFTFNLGDASAFSVKFGLYEKDDAAIYSKLSSMSGQLIMPDGIDLKALLKDSWEIIKNFKVPTGLGDIGDVLDTLKSISDIAKKVNNFLKQDDLMGEKYFEFHSLVSEIGLTSGQYREYRVEQDRLISDYIYDFGLQLKVS